MAVASGLNENFILNEDDALRSMLQGMTVSDSKNPSRPVKVYYGMPDPEIVDQAFPFVTIDLVHADEATDRAMRGLINLTYVPEGGPDLDENGYGMLTEYPIAYDLLYQLTTYARDPRHDRKLMNYMARLVGGRYNTLFIPQDNTERSMFLTGMQKRDRYDGKRRLFSNAYSVVVYSEMYPSQLEQAAKVRNIDLGINGQHHTITSN